MCWMMSNPNCCFLQTAAVRHQADRHDRFGGDEIKQ